MKPDQTLTLDFSNMIFKRVTRIHEDISIPESERADLIFKILHYLYSKWCEYENLTFHTFFGKVAYIGDKYQFNGHSLRIIHGFRKSMEQERPKGQADRGICAVYLALFERLGYQDDPFKAKGLLEAVKPRPYEYVSYRPFARVLVLSCDIRSYQLEVIDRDQPDARKTVQFNITGRNDNFNSSIEFLQRQINLPVPASLLRVEIDADDVYMPAGIVLQPDYLVDVTAISECFQATGPHAQAYLLNKLLPKEGSKYLLIGHLANFFLDRLLTDPALIFRDLLMDIFDQAPLQFAQYQDDEVRELLVQLQMHFNHLKETIVNQIESIGIDRSQCMIEPSYYSPEYGIQGRLDAFYADHEKKTAIILELKSGRPFRTNAYGLNHNHFIQTVLYDLLIKSAYRGAWNPMAYILYSRENEHRLRYAPSNSPQQMEAIQVRNGIMAIEAQMLKSKPGKPSILDTFDEKQLAVVGGFIHRDAIELQKIYQGLPAIEKKYIKAFLGFLSREQHISKVGDDSFKDRNGFASLWLNRTKSKEEKFTILTALELIDDRSGEDSPILRFKRTNETNDLANFRVGDIIVLYPGVLDSPVHYQMFKASIISMDAVEIEVRLRSVQRNREIFGEHVQWNLEHDFLDSSFHTQFRNLFKFATYPKEQRSLYLGQRRPAFDQNTAIPTRNKALTDHQQSILERMKMTRDYFLLWGPPGTGKTSVMLKSLVEDLYHGTEDEILVLSYTNRAVDEICDAVLSIDDGLPFYRIGSRYATGEKYRQFLLRNVLAGATSRNDLKRLLNDRRITVATVASFLGRSEITKFKNFKWLIIDEAAQILEPYLVGILPDFERVIMIGDHMQLPAVVQQHERESVLEDEDLKAIGLSDMRRSLFERLYRRCHASGWNDAVAQLGHQGRMHRDISRHISRYYYDDKLEIVDYVAALKKRQTAPLMSQLSKLPESVSRQFVQRIQFIDAASHELEAFRKINEDEAARALECLERIQSAYKLAGVPIQGDTIGIITPFRAQIALIKHMMAERFPEMLSVITVDTVERYQGGARDIIILSLCSNSDFVFEAVVNENEAGLDRKLNVALTRAREMLFIIGNKRIIQKHRDYAALLSYIASLEGV